MQLRLNDLRTRGYDSRGRGHCEGDQACLYFLGFEHADGQQQWQRSQRSQQWNSQGQQYRDLGVASFDPKAMRLGLVAAVVGAASLLFF